MLHCASLNVTELQPHYLVQRGKEIHAVYVVNIAVSVQYWWNL